MKIVLRRLRPVLVLRAFPSSGAAALAMVLRYHGLAVSLAEVRRRLRLEARGASLPEMQQAAAGLGLGGRPVRIALSQFGQAALPAVALLTSGHSVVVYDLPPGSAVLGGPARGVVKVPRPRAGEASGRFSPELKKEVRAMAGTQGIIDWEAVSKVVTPEEAIHLLLAEPLLADLGIGRLFEIIGLPRVLESLCLPQIIEAEGARPLPDQALADALAKVPSDELLDAALKVFSVEQIEEALRDRQCDTTQA